MILSPEGPYVMVESTSVVTNGGNNDIIEYGESVELSIILENVGSDLANSVQVNITTDDNFIDHGSRQELLDIVGLNQESLMIIISDYFKENNA